MTNAEAAKTYWDTFESVDAISDVTLRTYQTIDGQGVEHFRREVVDELLGITAHDKMEGPYVDLYVEGATVPFDTINVWKYGEGEREDNDMVLDSILDKFRELREEDSEY